MALWTYSLIVYWYLTGGDSNAGAALPRLPWYASKKTPAFSDMLAAVRRESWRQRLADPAGATRFDEKSLPALLDAVGYG